MRCVSTPITCMMRCMHTCICVSRTCWLSAPICIRRHVHTCLSCTPGHTSARVRIRQHTCTEISRYAHVPAHQVCPGCLDDSATAQCNRRGQGARDAATPHSPPHTSSSTYKRRQHHMAETMSCDAATDPSSPLHPARARVWCVPDGMVSGDTSQAGSPSVHGHPSREVWRAYEVDSGCIMLF